MQAEFKQGYIPEETILELRPDRAVVEKVHAAIVAWINEKFDRVMAAGLCCPSMGEWDDDLAWADLDAGPVQVSIPEGTIQIVFYNEPEGDDRLDGGHPHWLCAHDHLWMFAVPRVRQLLEGNLK
jgi:hypothetical protein